MLRPLATLSGLAVAVLLLAPTVASVQQGVEALDIRRAFPWEIWKWNRHIEPSQTLLPPPNCDDREEDTVSEVTDWPERIRKSEPYDLGGTVLVPGETYRGLADVTVDVFLNETKELPGILLGVATTDATGRFTLDGRFPPELQAQSYHLVANAHQKRVGCVTYREHWSDPEMKVTASSAITWDLPREAVLGHESTIAGWLLDDVGGPVRDAEVDLFVDGAETKLRTAADGRFVLPWTPTRAGNVTLEADFDATEYYDGSHEEISIEVLEEDVVLDTLVAQRFDMTRGQVALLSGRVLLAEGAAPSPLRVLFDGIRVAGCTDGCNASEVLVVTPDATGAFRVEIVAPHDTRLGEFTFSFDEGGLRQPREFDGAVFGTVVLTVDAAPTSFIARDYTTTVVARDDSGAPATGEVAVETEGEWRSGPVDAAAAFSFGAASSCGTHRVRALHNGTEWLRPAVAEDEVELCPWLAALPPWLLATPWWLWLLVLLLVVGSILVARRVRERYATTITRGPPLTLTFTQPADAAAGIVGVGEAATATAFLEDPLPEGHTLRLGRFRKMAVAAVGPDLRASAEVTPTELGEVAVRGEILDRRGRVVTRRTIALRVVRYAEEIETRHLALRRERLGANASAVTPREFQRWLAERSPDLDADVARRLVGIFEEADYGPRDASRRELVAYMEAEAALAEVPPRVA